MDNRRFGGRREGSWGGSKAAGQWVPVGSVDESSGNRGRGSRGRGRGSRGRGRNTTSWSPRNSSGYGNDQHSPMQVYNKSNVEKGFQEDIKSYEPIVGSAKQPDHGADLKLSGDNKDLFKLSASSSSKNTSLSGGSFEDKGGARMGFDLVNKMKDVSLSYEESVSSTTDHKVELSSVEDHISVQRDGGARMGFDLVNKMKDVSLSYEESVSSTTDHKVELSSVEDHISVQRDGGAVNSSNESNTRPFDLFLRKKVIVLKPSLLELNRDRRKETKGCTGIVIRPGMVLLKNFLSINDQVRIVNKCRELGLGEGGFYQPGYRNGALLHLKMLCLGKNWDPETSKYGETRLVDGSAPPKIPVEFSQLVGKAIQESHSLVATKGELPDMSPDICIVNFYTSTGRLGLHQDKDESQNSIRKGLPVVSFSIGDSAEFLYGDQRGDDKAEMVVLESGDVLLFGGKSRNIFHGVRSIHKDTAPKVLVQQTNLRPGRLNLTFRQY